MIKVIIIEDEYAGQELLKQIILDHFPECEIPKICGTVSSGIEAIQLFNPDIVLIDVELQDGTGFDILSQFKNGRKFEVIFVTAYSKYALNAIKESALDYILKPININELVLGLKNAISKTKEKTITSYPKYISIATNNNVELIQLNEIVFLEADRSYTHVYTKTQEIISSKSIGDFFETLPQNQFFRTHHSFVVNLSHIKSIKKNRGGMILMNSGHHIPISQRKLKTFLDLFEKN